MAIITISRGSYSHGREVAEKVARRLGYECVSREMLLEAAGQFNIPEFQLARALHDAPSMLERFTHGKEKYVAYITAAFLEHVGRDNVVYHGLAGHFFLKGVSHVLKVRVLSDLDERVRLEAEREHISHEEALKLLKKDDEERRKWGLALYGLDTTDSALYDLVVHLRKITPDDAAEIIVHAASREIFQATEESRAILADLSLTATVRARLVDQYPDIAVAFRNGRLEVETAFPLGLEEDLVAELTKIAGAQERVREVQLNLHPLV